MRSAAHVFRAWPRPPPETCVPRAGAGGREGAVRTALGAARSRLARQFLTESVVVTAIGGVLGLGVAYWGSKLLVSKAPRSIPRASEIGIDANVLLFLLGLSAVT